MQIYVLHTADLHTCEFANITTRAKIRNLECNRRGGVQPNRQTFIVLDCNVFLLPPAACLRNPGKQTAQTVQHEGRLFDGRQWALLLIPAGGRETKTQPTWVGRRPLVV